PQLAEPLAQRQNLGFDRELRLFDFAQGACGPLHRIARGGQRLLAAKAPFDRRIEPLAHARDRIRGELLGELGHLELGALDLLVDHVHRVIDLGDLRGAFAFAEERVLSIALGLLHGLALLRKRAFGAEVLARARFESGASAGDLFADGGRGATARAKSILALLGFGGELGLLGLELRDPLAIALLGLRELEALDLGVVPRLFLAGDRLAAVLERRLALDALALGLLEPMLSVSQLARELGAAALERLDLGLACEQARIGGI